MNGHLQHYHEEEDLEIFNIPSRRSSLSKVNNNNNNDNNDQYNDDKLDLNDSVLAEDEYDQNENENENESDNWWAIWMVYSPNNYSISGHCIYHNWWAIWMGFIELNSLYNEYKLMSVRVSTLQNIIDNILSNKEHGK